MDIEDVSSTLNTPPVLVDQEQKPQSLLQAALQFKNEMTQMKVNLKNCEFFQFFGQNHIFSFLCNSLILLIFQFFFPIFNFATF